MVVTTLSKAVTSISSATILLQLCNVISSDVTSKPDLQLINMTDSIPSLQLDLGLQMVVQLVLVKQS